ncbi:DUF6103 family protein [Bengtsoniella intestinalis]|uniref:DUF6103 family protein n=1 Tax=Bengtsoniella intestinalis TaxID=3073143 RepID=UPI00391EE50F
MKKENITISMEQEKLRAIKRYMAKKDADIEAELQAALQKLYEKYVPSAVQEYIDENELKATKPKESSQSQGGTA